MLCALFLIAMIVLIGAEAIARNVFATSLQITDEIGGYLLVALTFLSMSVAEAHGAFHRVELIQSRLNARATDHPDDLRCYFAGRLPACDLAAGTGRDQFVAIGRRRTDATGRRLFGFLKSVMSVEHGAAVFCFNQDDLRQGTASSRERIIVSPGIELILILAIFLGLLCAGMTIPFAITGAVNFVFAAARDFPA